MTGHDDRSRWREAWARRLRRARGPAYWRSLDELADAPEFTAWLADEFPAAALEVRDGALLRREFLKLMAASFALAGLTACGRDAPEKIVPHVRAPEHGRDGNPVFFATTLARAGYGLGVVVETHEGRPVKVEGNPAHPASLGRTHLHAQADVLDLYDPDRSQAVRGPDGVATWDHLAAALGARRERWQARRGAGLRLLTGHVTSPTLLAQIGALLAALPEARWHAHEPVGLDAAREGCRLATGAAVEPVLNVAQARVVVALDADLLGTLPGCVRHAHEFVAGRRGRLRSPAAAAPNRLWAAEPSPSLTGASADHRLPVRRGDVPALAAALARRAGLDLGLGDAGERFDAPARRWLDAAAGDLRAHPGAALVVAGPAAPPRVHALALALNERLGAVGRTVALRPTDAALAGLEPGTLADLAAQMHAGAVTDLVILECNPLHTAPDRDAFAAGLARVDFAAHLGLHADETAAACAWHLPALHALESWGDARADDGTASLVQPVVSPLHGGRSALEVVALLRGEPLAAGDDLVRATWRARAGAADFASWWRRALRDGVAADTRPAPVDARVDAGAVRDAWRAAGPARLGAAGALELTVVPDPTLWDGRYANNGWLQELPRPLTSLTWGNALLVAPDTAQALGLENGRVARVTAGDRAIEAPAWILPGQAPASLTLSLGHGRTRAGRLGTGVGVDVGPLRTGDDPWLVAGVQVERTGAVVALAATQHHQLMEGRDLVRGGTFAQLIGGAWPEREAGHHESLYPPREPAGPQWGMVIDLGACIGCGVCTLACQAENNIPVVGADQVRRGREMHWIRVDRYFTGAPQAPAVVFQPVPCMHCEHAPCEPVCPVGATQHSHDGLNEMVYNRCVGTRYCSNNCPYKVRRFNFLRYAAPDLDLRRLRDNPDVTVRGRGVMEKCTYCVQRIRAADVAARREQRPIRDGEVVPACAQACPTEAIVFGDVADASSRVAQARGEPHGYHLLAELNTRPRTSYLAALRNPHPDLGGDGA